MSPRDVRERKQILLVLFVAAFFFWDFRMHTYILVDLFGKKEGQNRRKFSKLSRLATQIYRLRSRRQRSFSRALHHAVRVSIRLKSTRVVRMGPAFASRSFASSSSRAVVSNSFVRSHIFFRWVSSLPCSISDDWYCIILSFFRIVMTVKSSTYKPASAVTKSGRSSGR